MIFYTGSPVNLIDRRVRKLKSEQRLWEYGYCPEHDVVIISKDGTLGEIYKIAGLNIGLPEQPAEIKNQQKKPYAQKWEREEMPDGLNAENMHLKKYDEFIESQFKKRAEGTWCYINGHPIYIPGTYWYGLQWCRENRDYPKFRVIQNELMIFWEACKADQRSYGMDYVKNRRFGASLLAIIEQLESGTINEDKVLGMISKKGADCKKIFRRLIKCFKRLPPFFMPIWDGTNTPKTELVLEEPTKRRKSGEKISEGEGLGTIISWHNTELNAMDGEEIFRSMLDEAGKFPKETPFSDYWYTVKTSHRIGSNIVGKSMVVSTVNSKNKGGGEFKKIWDDSNTEKRNDNGQTKSGLYRIFIPSKYCLEGFFDEYGFSIVETPKKPIKNDLGKYVSIGCEEYLHNEAEALKDDPEKLNEFLRQFPNRVEDAFRDESDNCAFNLIKLQEQIEHNENELDDKWESTNEYSGNKEIERGNFAWKDGIQDTEVIWRPSKDGRFYLAKGCHPPMEYRSRWEEKYQNGTISKTPLFGEFGTIGVDPYNRSQTSDGRGSNGAIHLTTKAHGVDYIPKNTLILEYIDRPKIIDIFFEDVIMAAVYFSVPFLCELSNESFLKIVKERGYRNYSMNNPTKLYKNLNPTEKEFGGFPQQNKAGSDHQFYAIEHYVEEYIGVAKDGSNRPIGEMGYFPFTRTLHQLKDFIPDKRTDFDAYISFSLSLLGNQKRTYKVIEKPKAKFVPFTKYDNSGTVSKVAI